MKFTFTLVLLLALISTLSACTARENAPYTKRPFIEQPSIPGPPDYIYRVPIYLIPKH